MSKRLSIGKLMEFKTQSLLTPEERVDLGLSKDLIETLGYSRDFIVSDAVRYAGRALLRSHIFGNSEEDRKIFEVICSQVYESSKHWCGGLKISVFRPGVKTKHPDRLYININRLSKPGIVIEVRMQPTKGKI